MKKIYTANRNKEENVFPFQYVIAKATPEKAKRIAVVMSTQSKDYNITAKARQGQVLFDVLISKKETAEELPLSVINEHRNIAHACLNECKEINQ